MDYLFRLADGRRLALWSERNQIIRQLSGGGGNRSHITLRTDFLSDLAAVILGGRIYFVYQNSARMVMLYLPDAEEDLPLFGESIESCRHSGLTLTVWEDSLYLFYTAWSPIREKYSLKVRKLSAGDATHEGAGGGGNHVVAGGFGDSAETVLAQEFDEPPRFQLVSEADQLQVIVSNQCWRLTAGEGAGGWQAGEWLEQAAIETWKRAEEDTRSLVKEVQQMTAESQRQKAEYRQLEEENRRQTAEYRQLEEENRRQTAECRRLEEESQRQKAECRQLETAYQRAESVRAQQEQRADQAEHENRLLTEEVQRLSEECEKLGLERNHAREEGEKLREERQKEVQERQKEADQYRGQLQSAVKQYNELAEVARQLQIEGKKWREKYFQEVKKRKDRVGTGKVRKTEE